MFKEPKPQSAEGQSLDEWISSHRAEAASLELPEEHIRSLIPERVFGVAEDPDKVDVMVRPSGNGELSFMVIERDYPHQLTDEAAWRKWQEDIKRPDVRQAVRRIKIDPPPPEGVDRLHEKNRDIIETGALSLKDRIIFELKLGVKSGSADTLMVVDYDGETGKGIAKDLYRETLPEMARKLGFRYLYGKNGRENISFFAETLGRSRIADIKPEFREKFFPGMDLGHPRAELDTVQFLYPEDEAKYRISV